MKKIIYLVSLSLLLVSCFIEKNVLSSNQEGLAKAIAVTDFSLFGNQLEYEYNSQKVVKQKRMTLLFRGDSLSFISIGKENPYAKNNILFFVSRYKDGFLLSKKAHLRYYQTDSVFFGINVCVKKTAQYEDGYDVKSTLPISISLKSFYLGTESLILNEEIGFRNDSALLIMNINQYCNHFSNVVKAGKSVGSQTVFYPPEWKGVASDAIKKFFRWYLL